MKATVLTHDHGRRERAVIFDADDEVMAGLKWFAAEQNLSAARFVRIGALAGVTTGWFNPDTKAYESTAIDEQVELLSLAGDVATGPDGKPGVHGHLVVGKRDGTAHGGRLQRAVVRPTLERVVTEMQAHPRKTFRPEFGLALIDVPRSTAD